jgi:hypothetical protein
MIPGDQPDAHSKHGQVKRLEGPTDRAMTISICSTLHVVHTCWVVPIQLSAYGELQSAESRVQSRVG